MGLYLEVGESLSLKPLWSVYQVPGQPISHSENLSQKTKTKPKQLLKAGLVSLLPLALHRPIPFVQFDCGVKGGCAKDGVGFGVWVGSKGNPDAKIV